MATQQDFRKQHKEAKKRKNKAETDRAVRQVAQPAALPAASPAVLTDGATRWRVCGRLTVKSPMHIGDGNALPDARVAHTQNREQQAGGDVATEATVATIVRDVKGKPAIPGTALKGALRHHAKQVLVGDDACFKKLFGSPSGGGWVTFCAGRWAKDIDQSQLPSFCTLKQTAVLPAAARDRDTRAVAAKKLFFTEVVPPDAIFDVTLYGEDLSLEELKTLLGLLQAFSDDFSGLALGADEAAAFGRASWSLTEVNRIDATGERLWWDQPQGGPLWALGGKWFSTFKSVPADKLHSKRYVNFPVDINIDGPFLVNDPSRANRNNADFRPRRNHAGGFELPSKSLHGALRAQAERICRTVGLPVENGDAVRPGAQETCLVSFLFGAPGWRSLLRCKSLTTTEGISEEELPKQEFVAIDRFAGGVSGSAKFNGLYVLSPTLSGQFGIDQLRLGVDAACAKDAARAKAALGLLLLTLRDLDEGDIPLGYGAAAKGYGAVATNTETRRAMEGVLKQLKTTLGDELTAEDALTAFRMAVTTRTASAGYVAHTTLTAPTVAALVDHGTESRPPIDRPTARLEDAEFHNTYAFLPFGANVEETIKGWQKASEFVNRQALHGTHHSHARYASSTSDELNNQVFSGRLICSLKTITPTVVGGTQRAAAPSEVAPFKLGNELAIPATSLRGMIGALIEAASGSSLRVLSNQHEDRRLDATQGVLTDKMWLRIPAGGGITKSEPLGKSVDEFFAAVSPELLPFNGNRERVSPAEWMLGFVSDDVRTSEPKNRAWGGFASKVRFSFGRHAAQQEPPTALLSKITLKILASPKPPSPAMYFKPKTGDAYVSKLCLYGASNKVDPLEFLPKGRQKVYLHAKPAAEKDVIANAETKSPQRNANQKLTVEPIRCGETFWFHVDFDNLSLSEAQLLCFALRPTNEHQHRLGLGKSLGLGSVKVDIAGLLLTDRSKRYSSDKCSAPRAHQVWWAEGNGDTLPSRYAIEKTCKPSDPTVSPLALAGAAAVDAATMRAIELTGNPAHVIAPVHAPLREDQKAESETFKWFVENDKAAIKQFITAITPDSCELPRVKKN